MWARGVDRAGGGKGRCAGQVALPIPVWKKVDGKFPAVIDEVLADAGIQTVLCGVRVPRMNAIMERWVQSCRHELLDRTLIWNERHLRHALHQYEQFYNAHRAHQTMMQAAPLRAVPAPIADIGRIAHLDIRRRDRLGGVLHEYQHAA